jgi:hypothetical protein
VLLTSPSRGTSGMGHAASPLGQPPPQAPTNLQISPQTHITHLAHITRIASLELDSSLHAVAPSAAAYMDNPSSAPSPAPPALPPDPTPIAAPLFASKRIGSSPALVHVLIVANMASYAICSEFDFGDS